MVGSITGSGLDVFISQSVIGLVGLIILWGCWREAVHLQLAQNVPVEQGIPERANAGDGR